MIDIEALFDEKFGKETFQTSGIQIKKRCPECHHKALSCNLEVGIYRCFQCDYSGKIDTQKTIATKPKKKFSQSLQRQMMIKILKESTLKDSHRSYLNYSGILYPEKWGLKSVPRNLRQILSEWKDSELLKSGLFRTNSQGILSPCPALTSDAIIIPYWENGNYVAGKTRNVILSTSSKYKYMCINESPVSKFLYDCSIPDRKDLIVTEGEKKAMVANSFGFSTVAFGGLGFSEDGIKKLRGTVVRKKIKRLFIILDKDEDWESCRSAKIQACKLYEALPNIACIVFLDQMNPNKVGLDDYLLNYGSEELTWILEETWKNRKEEYEKWKMFLSQ